jgi:hypothetical protein
VRQPHHLTVRVLKQLTIGGLSSSGTGQSGAAPDTHCSLSGAPLTLLALFFTVQRSARLLQSTIARVAVAPLVHRTVRWHTGQSGEL